MKPKTPKSHKHFMSVSTVVILASVRLHSGHAWLALYGFKICVKPASCFTHMQSSRRYKYQAGVHRVVFAVQKGCYHSIKRDRLPFVYQELLL